MTTLKTSFNQHLEHKRDKGFLVILLFFNIFGFIAIFGAYFLTQNILRLEKTKIFEQQSEQILQIVEQRMLNHVYTLRGLQAFWNRNPEGITAERFKLYIDSINLFWDYPGISSVAFVKNEKGKYLTQFLEPEAVRQQAGLLNNDQAAIPERKIYFDRARDEGRIVSTDQITLITTKRLGMFLIAPIYQGGLIPQSLVERQEKLLGFIGLVFRENNLFTTIFGRQNPLPDLDFVVYHEHELPDHILFDSDPEFKPDNYQNLSQTKRYLTIGHTPWIILISTKPSFSLKTTEEKLPLALLSIGLILFTAFAGLNYYFYRQHLKRWHR